MAAQSRKSSRRSSSPKSYIDRYLDSIEKATKKFSYSLLLDDNLNFKQ